MSLRRCVRATGAVKAQPRHADRITRGRRAPDRNTMSGLRNSGCELWAGVSTGRATTPWCNPGNPFSVTRQGPQTNAPGGVSGPLAYSPGGQQPVRSTTARRTRRRCDIRRSGRSSGRSLCSHDSHIMGDLSISELLCRVPGIVGFCSCGFWPFIRFHDCHPERSWQSGCLTGLARL